MGDAKSQVQEFDDELCWNYDIKEKAAINTEELVVDALITQTWDEQGPSSWHLMWAAVGKLYQIKDVRGLELMCTMSSHSKQFMIVDVRAT